MAYIPDGKVVGISKLARVTEAFALRLQIQERLTAQIAECLHKTLSTAGAAVMIEAEHHCMTVRVAFIHMIQKMVTHIISQVFIMIALSCAREFLDFCK